MEGNLDQIRQEIESFLKFKVSTIKVTDGKDFIHSSHKRRPHSTEF